MEEIKNKINSLIESICNESECNEMPAVRFYANCACTLLSCSRDYVNALERSLIKNEN